MADSFSSWGFGGSSGGGGGFGWNIPGTSGRSGTPYTGGGGGGGGGWSSAIESAVGHQLGRIPGVSPTEHFVGHFLTGKHQAADFLTHDLWAGLWATGRLVASDLDPYKLGQVKRKYTYHWTDSPFTTLEHYFHDPGTTGGALITPMLSSYVNKYATSHVAHNIGQDPLGTLLDATIVLKPLGIAHLAAMNAELARVGEGGRYSRYLGTQKFRHVLADTNREVRLGAKEGDYGNLVMQLDHRAKTSYGRYFQQWLDDKRGSVLPVWMPGSTGMMFRRAISREGNDNYIRYEQDARQFQLDAKKLTPMERKAIPLIAELPRDVTDPIESLKTLWTKELEQRKADRAELLKKYSTKEWDKVPQKIKGKFNHLDPTYDRMITHGLHELEAIDKHVIYNPRPELMTAIESARKAKHALDDSLMQAGVMNQAQIDARRVLVPRLLSGTRYVHPHTVRSFTESATVAAERAATKAAMAEASTTASKAWKRVMSSAASVKRQAGKTPEEMLAEHNRLRRQVGQPPISMDEWARGPAVGRVLEGGGGRVDRALRKHFDNLRAYRQTAREYGKARDAWQKAKAKRLKVRTQEDVLGHFQGGLTHTEALQGEARALESYRKAQEGEPPPETPPPPPEPLPPPEPAPVAPTPAPAPVAPAAPTAMPAWGFQPTAEAVAPAAAAVTEGVGPELRSVLDTMRPNDPFRAGIEEGLWTVKETHHDDRSITVLLEPKGGGAEKQLTWEADGRTFNSGRGPTHYDPKVAEVRTVHGREHVMLKKDEPRFIADALQKEPGMIYRGVSDAEWQDIQRTGRIKSNGSYNLGEAQSQYTMFADEPATAGSYASSFAPAQHKPTFEKPARVLVVREPAEGVVRNDPTLAPNGEVAVAGDIPASQIHEVWRGDVYEMSSGEMNLVKQSDGHWESGGGVVPTSDVYWQREAAPAAARAEPTTGRQLGAEAPTPTPLPEPLAAPAGPVTFRMRLPRNAYYAAQGAGLDVGEITQKPRGSDRLVVKLTEEQMRTLRAEATKKGAGPSGGAMRRAIDNQQDVMHEAMGKATQKLDFQRSPDGSYHVPGADSFIIPVEGRYIAHTSTDVIGEYGSLQGAKRAIEKSLAYKRTEARNAELAATTTDPFARSLAEEPLAMTRPKGTVRRGSKGTTREPLQTVDAETLQRNFPDTYPTVADAQAQLDRQAAERAAPVTEAAAPAEAAAPVARSINRHQLGVGASQPFWSKWVKGVTEATIHENGRNIPLSLTRKGGKIVLRIGGEESTHANVTEAKAAVLERVKGEVKAIRDYSRKALEEYQPANDGDQAIANGAWEKLKAGTGRVSLSIEEDRVLKDALDQKAQYDALGPAEPRGYQGSMGVAEKFAAEQRAREAAQTPVTEPVPPPPEAAPPPPEAAAPPAEAPPPEPPPPPPPTAASSASGWHGPMAQYGESFRWPHYVEDVSHGAADWTRPFLPANKQGLDRAMRSNAGTNYLRAQILLSPDHFTKDILRQYRWLATDDAFQKWMVPLSGDLDIRLADTGFKERTDYYIQTKVGSFPTDIKRALSSLEGKITDAEEEKVFDKVMDGRLMTEPPPRTHVGEADEVYLKRLEQAGIRRVPAQAVDAWKKETGNHAGFFTRVVAKKGINQAWRYMLLGLKPAWSVANAMTNEALVMLKYAGVGGGRAFISLIRNMHGPAAVERLFRQTMGMKELTPTQKGFVALSFFPELKGGSLAKQLQRQDERFGSLAPRAERSAVVQQARKIGGWANEGYEWKGKKLSALAAVRLPARLNESFNEWGENFARDQATRVELHKFTGKWARTAEDFSRDLESLTDEQRQHIVNEVRDLLGDYSNLSAFERNKIVAFMPFYPWFKTILGITGRFIVRNPERLWFLHAISTAFLQQGQANYFQLGIPLPDFASTLVPIASQPTQGGTQMAFSQQTWNPFQTPVDIARIIQNVTRGDLSQVQPSGTGLSLFGPIPQAAFVALSGKDPLFGGQYRGLGSHQGPLFAGLGSVIGGFPQQRLIDQWTGGYKSKIYASPTTPSPVPGLNEAQYVAALQYLGVPVREVDIQNMRARALLQQQSGAAAGPAYPSAPASSSSDPMKNWGFGGGGFG